jgi:tetratricopeptide (TPR) repeat protein
MLLESMEQYEKAKMLTERILYIQTSHLGGDHSGTIGTLFDLASLHKLMQQYDEAESLLLQAVQLLEKNLDSNRPAFVTALNNLAVLYELTQRYEESEKFYLHALDIDLTSSPQDCPKTDSIHERLSRMIQTALEAGEAEQLSDNPTTQEVLRQLQESGNLD